MRIEASGGILLLICTVVALAWANSPWKESYHHFFHDTVLSFGISGLVTIEKDLIHWINDGLMAIFFFVVGLEIKRELLVGELASIRKAALPITAAAGGMLIPAGVFALILMGRDGMQGWGIPMATDIAFAVGVIALLGKRVPIGLKVFLVALAIVDDIGAVLVIALFYTDRLDWTVLIAAHAVLLVSIILNLAGVRRSYVYATLGAIMWILVLKSGVHATIAGVLMAMTIPSKIRLYDAEFLRSSRALLDEFEKAGDASDTVATNQTKQSAIHTMEQAMELAQPPLLRIEHMLVKWVAFFIMPVFALANAGVTLGSGFLSMLLSPVSIGIALGLVVGKQIGVTFFTWLAVKFGFGSLPTGVTWMQVYGASLLAGIGFTMSLFIAGLAYTEDATMLEQAKVGILCGSLIAGVSGYLILRKATAPRAA